MGSYLNTVFCAELSKLDEMTEITYSNEISLL